MSKSNVLKISVLSMCLLGLFLGVTNWATVTKIEATHTPRVYTLYLWSWEDVWIKTSDNNLIITNWMVIWGDNSYSRSTAASIWWWSWNAIDNSSNYAWIWWGRNNTITSWENSMIAWWLSNSINGQNAVVAWGQGNTSYSLWNVLWWTENVAEGNWVVLWWYHNEAHKNSLALWKNASASNKSFAWNTTANTNSARIDASNWILIWTTIPITWVNLVVNWAIKIWWTSSATWVAWEIRFVSGCFYAYDWANWHIINKNSTSSCNALTVSQVCKFGNIELQEWDKASAYNATLSEKCESKNVTCFNWELVDDAWGTGYKYAYCFNTD